MSTAALDGGGQVEAGQLVRRAGSLAARLLADDPTRLAHVRSAAWHAGLAAGHLPAVQRDTVVAAAWLHDIGYLPALARTGFHPLDGALHLIRSGWPDEVARLVAHHSFSRLTAPFFGVAHHLAVIEPVLGSMADVLVFADVVSGRDGTGVAPEDRIAEMRYRHAALGVPVPPAVREERYRLLLTTAREVASWAYRPTVDEPTVAVRPAADEPPRPASG